MDSPLRTRKEALAIGASNYFTGKPCHKGHIAERHVSDRKCAQCRREYRQKLWHERPDIRKANNEYKAHKLANNPEFREAERKRLKEFQAKKRKETGGAYAREYRKKNAEKIKAQTRNRRARIKKAEGHHTYKDIKDILRMQNGKCGYCRVELGKSYHVDHIMPLVLGGSNGRRNLQCLCADCNLSKAQYDPLVYARSLGLLL